MFTVRTGGEGEGKRRNRYRICEKPVFSIDERTFYHQSDFYLAKNFFNQSNIYLSKEFLS